jgi:crotonobetaine/carnitine-CoA ligase
VNGLLLDVVAQRAATFPDTLLLQEVDGPQLSALEAYDRALRWADMLEAHGVAAGETVAAMMPTSVNAVTAWWGSAWLGAIDVPVSPEYRGDLLVSILTRAQARTLVVEGALLDRLVQVADRLPLLETVLVVSPPRTVPPLPFKVLDALSELSRHEPLNRSAPGRHDVACGIFTSGTTGEAKCVLVPWGQIHRMYAETLGRPWGPDEATYVHGPFNHLIARGLVYQGVVAPGGRAVLRRRLSTDHWWRDVRDFGCTEANIPGVVAHWLLEHPVRHDDAENPMRRVCIAPLIPQARAFAQRFGVHVFTSYGSSEAGIPLLLDEVVDDDPTCCGSPAPNSEVRLVAPGTQTQLDGTGVVGELEVRSDPWAVSLGYLPGAGPSDPDRLDGWIATGDAFYLDDEGNYHFVDRWKDVIRRRGENISPLSIELEASTHPAVSHAAAVAVPAEESEDEIKLFVECRPGHEVSMEDLVAYLADRLPAFMVPRYIEVLTQLPRTATGKVRRADLRGQPALNGATYERATGRVR